LTFIFSEFRIPLYRTVDRRLTVFLLPTFFFLRFVPFSTTLLTVAIAILSFYGGSIVLYKIAGALTGKPKAIETEVVAKIEAPTTGVPGIETEAFEKWVETDAFTNLLENEEQLKSLVESL
jgi:hypothetical protein